MRKLFYMGAVGLALGITTSVTFAHATLERASPPVGGAVSGSPGQIRLWFTEALEPRSSGAEVIGPSGNRIGRGTTSGNQLIISVPRLGAGTYRVNWHVRSIDGHKTEGSYTFEITR